MNDNKILIEEAFLAGYYAGYIQERYSAGTEQDVKRLAKEFAEACLKHPLFDEEANNND